MSKPSPKKNDKRRRKAKEEAAKRVAYEKTKSRRQGDSQVYPEIVFRESDAPDGLVNLIKSIVAEISFEDGSLFPPEMQRYYQAVKEIGAQAVFKLFSGSTNQSGDYKFFALKANLFLGSLISHSADRGGVVFDFPVVT